jgi:hypothetical protein
MLRYITARQRGEFRGIAWFDGRLESTPLSGASTGNLGDAGLASIALLAFYDVQSTSAILQHVVPRCLINYNRSDEESAKVTSDERAIRGMQSSLRNARN